MTKHPHSDLTLEELAQKRRRERFDKIDAMPPELRSCVYDYGSNLVQQFAQCGVTKPKHIRHLIESVLDEFSPTRGAYSCQGIRTKVADE